MLLELGNPNANGGVDDSPCVTAIHIPEADENGLGGYSLVPGMSVVDYRQHIQDANDYNGGITHLPDHEILLACVEGWKTQSRSRPTWLKVTPHELTPNEHPDELERFLSEYFECPVTRPEDVEYTHWTRFGPPGQGGPFIPDLQALFTDDGRTQQSTNYGGGQVGVSGTGTAATATTLTTNQTLVTNAWAGYRVYVFNGTAMVWGNVISNTNTASASVLTVDRWYNAATPGGVAATTPASGFQFILADGGGVSAWFVGLSATNSPAHGDHALSGEITTAGGGLVRKISPYALTSGTSPGTYTLTPVFTANGTDVLPVTVAAAGAFNSMVVANTTLAMKFETGLSAAAAFAVSGDNATLTWTVTES